MSACGEVARPTLPLRGFLGQAEPILTAGGRALGDVIDIFVGIDVAKVRNAVAIADGERGGEVRFM
jgi:transposase